MQTERETQAIGERRAADARLDARRHRTLRDHGNSQATGGSTSKAAEMLGISVRTIQYRLHHYNEAPRSEIEVVRRPPQDDSDKS